MLGRELAKAFASYKSTLWALEDLDITDSKKTMEKIVELSPNVVINAAAYTNVPEAEKNQDLANNINGYAVGYIANACQLIGAVLVHYSTDYVFDGKNKKGYREEDEGSPVNIYGASKYLGEQMLLLKESQGAIKCPSFANCPKVQDGMGCDETRMRCHIQVVGTSSLSLGEAEGILPLRRSRSDCGPSTGVILNWMT